MSVIKKYDLHHTVIPPWIYRIPSELRSQAGLGLPSTVVGDHTGIVSAVCFFILFWLGVLYRVEFAKVFFVIVAKSRSRSVDWLVFFFKSRVV